MRRGAPSVQRASDRLAADSARILPLGVLWLYLWRHHHRVRHQGRDEAGEGGYRLSCPFPRLQPKTRSACPRVALPSSKGSSDERGAADEALSIRFLFPV